MNKILVVESSPTIKSVADSLLRQMGYDVTCLSDGMKALEFAKMEMPDLILSGLELTGLDGFGLCKKIFSDPITGGIPVVLFISEKEPLSPEKIDISGARGVIKKPFSPKELLNAVERFIPSESGRKIKTVSQDSGKAPKLKPKVAPQEIGTATRSIIDKNAKSQKHETVHNLDWENLNDGTGIGQAPRDKADLNDSDLILEEDQFGLTSLADEMVPASKEDDDEDYDWFVSEMKQELGGNADRGGTTDSPVSNEPKLSYQDLEKPITEKKGRPDISLAESKHDAGVVSQPQPSGQALDINWLVDRIAEKLAQRIMDKIDRDELKQIMTSILADKK